MKCNKKTLILSVAVALFLFSSALFAAAETLPYFQIAQEYASTPFQAKRKWIEKEISIEAEISSITKYAVGFVITFSKENPLGRFKFVEYDFYFKSNYDYPPLEKGQRVRISGSVSRLIISTSTTKRLYIFMENPKIIS